ncbi:MAG: hypothetical protein SGPRY_007228 [Prymnesium sp.]
MIDLKIEQRSASGDLEKIVKCIHEVLDMAWARDHCRIFDLVLAGRPDSRTTRVARRLECASGLWVKPATACAPEKGSSKIAVTSSASNHLKPATEDVSDDDLALQDIFAHVLDSTLSDQAAALLLAPSKSNVGRQSPHETPPPKDITISPRPPVSAPDAV